MFASLPAWVPWLAVALSGAASASLVAGWWRQAQHRRRAEHAVEELAAGQDRLAMLMRETAEIVVFTDVQRRITGVNDAFERLTGYTQAEALGQSPGQLLQCPETDRDTVLRMRQAMDAGQGFTGEILNRSRSGQLYWLELRILPLRDDAGQLSGFVALESDITARRQAEATLRASQAFLDKASRIGGVGAWAVDMQQGGLTWTAHACAILDHHPGDPPTLQDCLSICLPEGRSRLRQAIETGLAGGQPPELELPLRTRQGREIWVRVSAEVEHQAGRPVRVIGALQDITQRRLIKAEAQRSAALLRAAFEAVDEGLAVFDGNDRLVFCNQRYQQTYALTADLQQAGTPFEALMRTGAERGQYEAAQGRVDDWVRRRLAAFRDGGQTQVQRLANGRILRVLDRHAIEGHTVCFCVDITDLVRASEEAEDADRSKSAFIATISHELRTPLQAITGFSDLGRFFAQGDGRYQPMFEDIHAAGMRMLTLVNGLLDISKIDGGLGTLQLRPTDLGELCDEVLRELAPLLGQSGLSVQRPAGPVAWPVLGDPFRLQQVLRNVLANAIRFSPLAATVHIEHRQTGPSEVELCIRDEGPGIPEAELEQVFAPFVQSSRTRDGAGGTGLGLTISRKIVQAHGGHIHAECPPEGGTRICIRLPAHVPEVSRPAGAPKLLRRPATAGQPDTTSA